MHRSIIINTGVHSPVSRLQKTNRAIARTWRAPPATNVVSVTPQSGHGCIVTFNGTRHSSFGTSRLLCFSTLSNIIVIPSYLSGKCRSSFCHLSIRHRLGTPILWSSLRKGHVYDDLRWLADTHIRFNMVTGKNHLMTLAPMNLGDFCETRCKLYTMHTELCYLNRLHEHFMCSGMDMPEFRSIVHQNRLDLRLRLEIDTK